MNSERVYVAYMSCFGNPELTTAMSRRDALSIVEYLRNHLAARPLYMITVRGKTKCSS